MIPFAKPFLGEEAVAVGEAIQSGWVTQGPKVKEFEDAFASHVGAKHADSVSSSTAAFDLAMYTVGVKPGDGRMLVTNNPEYYRKFRLLRNHGMGSASFKKHGPKTVVIEEYLMTGYCYRMTDIPASVGIEQLKKLPIMLKNRKQAADYYHEQSKAVDWIETPYYCRTNGQTFHIIVRDNAPVNREEFMQRLLDLGVATCRGGL